MKRRHKIPYELRERYPDVPWPKIVAFRNFAVHRYFDLSWRIVVDAAFDDVPILSAQIEAILAAEFR